MKALLLSAITLFLIMALTSITYAGASVEQKALCKDGGWQGTLWNADTGELMSFKNQGQCVKAVNAGIVLTDMDPNANTDDDGDGIPNSSDLCPTIESDPILLDALAEYGSAVYIGDGTWELGGDSGGIAGLAYDFSPQDGCVDIFGGE